MASTETVFGWIGFAMNVIIANLIAHGLWSVFSKRNIIQWSARHFEQLYYVLIWSILFVIVERNIQLMGGILELFSFSLVSVSCLFTWLFVSNLIFFFGGSCTWCNWRFLGFECFQNM
eukprot:97769_1